MGEYGFYEVLERAMDGTEVFLVHYEVKMDGIVTFGETYEKFTSKKLSHTELDEATTYKIIFGPYWFGD